jgi:hypothetical protein
MSYTEKSLLEVIEILKDRGYTADFNLLEENLSYSQNGEEVDLNDIVIDKVYRFSVMNDVDDESILYAMRNIKDNVKGIMVNGYGTYTDSGANAVLNSIKVADHSVDEWEF